MTDQVTTEDPSVPQAKPQIDLDALAAKLANIQTEDGRQKYSDPEKAIESIPYKDEFIEKLKAETAELRTKLEAAESKATELETKVTIEDRIAEQVAKSQVANEQPSSQGFDEQTLADLVSNLVDKKDGQRRTQDNFKRFLDAVKDETDDAEAFIEKAASKSGLGPQFYRSMIAENPEAALKLIGKDVKASQPNKPQSSINTEALSGNPDTKAFEGRITDLHSSRDKMKVWNDLIKAKQGQ